MVASYSLILAGGYTVTTGIGNFVVAFGGTFSNIPPNHSVSQWVTGVACLISGIATLCIRARIKDPDRWWTDHLWARWNSEQREDRAQMRRTIQEHADHNRRPASTQ
jgi:hypothetical protein